MTTRPSTQSSRVDVELYEPPPSRRAFSPGDVVRLLVGLVLVMGGTLVAELARSTVEGFEEDLLSAFARFPDGFEEAVLSFAQLATALVPTVALGVLLFRRRWKVALLLIVTGVVASVAMSLADAAAIDRDLAEFLDSLRADQTARSSDFPDSGVIASTTAIVTVAAPWLSRRWKRILWYGVGVLVFLRLVAVAHPAFDLVLALGVGTAVGSLALLLYGSPSREPDPGELLASLRHDGYDPARIIRPGQRADGANRYEFVDLDGTERVLSLRTPDERDADLLNRFYRRVRFRASEVEVPYSSLQRRVEHEALVLAMADRADVRVPEVERVGTTSEGSAYLVMTHPATRPAEVEDLGTGGVLEDLWTQVRALHDAGIAHRRLSIEAFAIDGEGHVWLGRFDDARIAPDDRELARDVAVLLAETGLVIGPAPAVATAVETLGRERVASALRMLQPLALPTTTRARAKEADGLLEELRDEVNAATGEPELELEELERVKPRTLLIIGVSSLAFYSLLPQFANLEDTVDAFGDAEPLWIIGVLVASVVTYVFAAISFQGAVADPVPFAPTLRAQVAASFAGLVGPAGIGGIALTARFLERVGVRPAEAGASVAVDAIAGFAVHVALLGGFVLWAGNSELEGFSFPDSSTVLLVVAMVFAVVGVLLAIGPVRRKVFSPLWRNLKIGATQMGRVFQSPVRVAALFGGSAGISLSYVAAVACAVEAFGGGISLPQIGAAYLGALAIATLAPTPGGLGALESAMIAGFTGFGLDGGVAVSATLTFRLATFWLPILPGWVTVGWMQRNEEL